MSQVVEISSQRRQEHPDFTKSQYHGCWWPGNTRSQVINSHDINLNPGEYYSISTRGVNDLTHWGRVKHICVSNLTIIGSDNGLSPGRRQAITWTNDGILLIGPFGTNFSEMLIEIHTFSFKKIHLKMSIGKWRPFCLGLNVLRDYFFIYKQLYPIHWKWFLTHHSFILGKGHLQTQT